MFISPSFFLSFLRLPQFTLICLFYFVLFLFPCLNKKCDKIINSLNAFFHTITGFDEKNRLK
jgi:hypothetical protein